MISNKELYLRFLNPVNFDWLIQMEKDTVSMSVKQMNISKYSQSIRPYEYKEIPVLKYEPPKFNKYPEYDSSDPHWRTHSRFGHMNYNELYDAIWSASNVMFEMTGEHLQDGILGTVMTIITRLVRETDVARIKELKEKVNQNNTIDLHKQLDELSQNMIRPLSERTDQAYIPVKAYQTGISKQPGISKTTK